MATITLNIYKENNNKEIEKTYQVEGYDLMLGTVEDIINIVDVDKLNDKGEVAKMVVKGYSKIKPLLFDIFPGVTDEELNRVKIKELMGVMVDVAAAAAESINSLTVGN